MSKDTKAGLRLEVRTTSFIQVRQSWTSIWSVTRLTVLFASQS